MLIAQQVNAQQFGSAELTAWSGAIFIAAVEAYIIWNLVTNKKWDMSKLLCAEDGVASMSRFQLMLFTFAIVGGYFYLTIYKQSFPQVDPSAMGLLGISSGTYALSKGIQASRDTSMQAGAPPGGPAGPPVGPPPPPGANGGV